MPISRHDATATRTAIKLFPASPYARLSHCVFGERLTTITGTSHEYQINIEELKENPKYQFGFLVVPIKGSQEVKAIYLQRAYEAAVLLNLYPPQEPEDEEDEQDNTN